VTGADGGEGWTGEECAAAWGVKPATWLGYVSRGQAPPPRPGRDAAGRRRWDPEEVRSFPRPGVGRSRAGAAPEATALLAQMRAVADQVEHLRVAQRELLRTGRRDGLEIQAMARALGISRQTAYSWLADDERSTRSGG
jgi:DNA-directed RNA polymerase specialized sigma24 family protein